MKKRLDQFWMDEAGFVVSTELVLVATVLVLGVIVGIASVRDQVISELGDVALSISNVNESYVFYGITGHTSSTAGSDFLDQSDFCDSGEGMDPGLDNAGFPPACIVIGLEQSRDEGTPVMPIPGPYARP